MAELHQCPQCDAKVEAGHRFCGHCGYKMQIQAPKTAGAALVRIHGGGADGARYELAKGEQTIGRNDGSIAFPDDPFVSDQHAKLHFNGKSVFVSDLDSDNGVFVRIKGPVKLNVGDEFLAGEELLVLEEVPLADSFRDDQNTYFFGSVQPATGLRIRQVLEGGFSGGGIMARGSMVTIGREDVEIEFPEDRFISGRHCALEFTPTGYTLTDLGSRNGTFVRINSTTTLSHGDFLFLGRQLLRVEVSSGKETGQSDEGEASA